MIKKMLNNNYNTPAKTRRSWMDRIFLGTRIWGVIGIINVIRRSYNHVKNGRPQQKFFAQDGVDFMRVFEKCQAKFCIEGMDNISKVDGPVIFIGNHMSMIETLVLTAMINPRRNATFVIKKSLIDMTYFGKIMKGMNCIAVARTNPKDDFKAVIKEGKDRLHNNQSVIIFPQSTRSVYFEPKSFNSIGMKLAKLAGVPIIPLALKTDFLSNGKIIKDFGPFNRDKTVHFAFGEPLYVEGTGKKQHQQVIDFITAKVTQWGVEIRA